MLSPFYGYLGKHTCYLSAYVLLLYLHVINSWVGQMITFVTLLMLT